MFAISKPTTKRLLTIHGWSGVLLGLALYVVVFTGAIVVFSSEIGLWSVSGKQVEQALVGPIDAKLTELADSVDEAYLHDVSLWQNSAGYLVAFFHTHVMTEEGKPAEEGTRFVINPDSMEVISRHDGISDEMPEVKSSFLEHFYVDLHVRLHAPDPIGLYLTGILGFVLLIAAVSGLILHRHLIKDIFLSPRLSTRLLNARDRHNLAGTWGMIFSILLAFTGAFFSFATTLGLPVIAMTAFGGDQEKAMSVIVGEPTVEDNRPMPFIGLETIVKASQQNEVAGSPPIIITVEHWGRADAVVSTIHSPSDETLFFSNHQFSGVTGEYLGEKPFVGTERSLGSILMGMMGVLHFGWFAGLFSKIIWLSLGLATCYVTWTGLQLWIERRESHPVWQRLGRLVPIVGFGTPIAMLTAALGFLFTFSSHPEWVESTTINGFFIGAVMAIACGVFLEDKVLRERTLQSFLGLILLVLPVSRWWISEQSWALLIHQQQMTVVAMDISLLFAGLIFLLLGLGFKQPLVFIKQSPINKTRAVS